MLVLIYIVEVHFNLISLLSLLTEKAAPVINSIDDVCRQCFCIWVPCRYYPVKVIWKSVRQKKNQIKLGCKYHLRCIFQACSHFFNVRTVERRQESWTETIRTVNSLRVELNPGCCKSLTPYDHLLNRYLFPLHWTAWSLLFITWCI